jgi:multiple sugar transport system ATP-binding protein
LSNLDAQLRAELRVEIKRLHQRISATMIYVTHDQIEALTLADRIAVMHGGVIQQLDTPQTIYARPANRFVASFVGSPAMNFLDGRFASDGGRAVVEVGAIRIPVEGYAFATRPAAGQPVTVGVRPEHVGLDGGAAGVPATIEMIEPMGAESLVWTRIGETPVSARVPSERKVAVGDSAPLNLPAARLSLFDTASGARL